MNLDEFMRINNPGNDCVECLELLRKIRAGELKGIVVSCHPLDEIAEPAIQRYIKSARVNHD
jgi:hypothetical protein